MSSDKSDQNQPSTSKNETTEKKDEPKENMLALVYHTIVFSKDNEDSNGSLLSSFKIRNICQETIFYKIKASNTQKYKINPIFGLLQPRGDAWIDVTLKDPNLYESIIQDFFEVGLIKFPEGNDEAKKKVLMSQLRSKDTNFDLGQPNLKVLWDHLQKTGYRQIEYHRIQCERKEEREDKSSDVRNKAKHEDAHTPPFTSQIDVTHRTSRADHDFDPFRAIRRSELAEQFVHNNLVGILIICMMVAIFVFLGHIWAIFEMPENKWRNYQLVASDSYDSQITNKCQSTWCTEQGDQ